MKARETTTVPWTDREMYRVTVRQEVLDRDGTDPDAPTSPGFAAFAETMAQGPCLCAEIAEQDRPCLTCEAQAVVAAGGGA